MDNMKSIINSHNKSILQAEPTSTGNKCNCTRKKICPLSGDCLASNIVYKGEIYPENANTSKTYIGITKPTFKERLGNHIKSFNHDKYKTDTELSKEVWNLKNSQNPNYDIKWSLLKQTRGYNPVTNSCGLCLSEKLAICRYKDKDKLLNKRSELISFCRHQSNFLLSNVK